MRLWHKDLISVLPDKQLLSQWRECCAIISKINKSGTPNHILVNKVLNYPILHFTCYTNKVIREINNRGYKVSGGSYVSFVNNCNQAACHFGKDPALIITKDTDIYSGWHNDKYLKQCFYNLQEKHDCGGITDDEWRRVISHVNLDERLIAKKVNISPEFEGDPFPSKCPNCNRSLHSGMFCQNCGQALIR